MKSLLHRSALIALLAFIFVFSGVSVVQAQSTSSDTSLSDLQTQIEQLQQRVQTLAEEVANQRADLSERIAQEEQMQDDDTSTSTEESEDTGTSTEERTSLPSQAAPQASITRQLGMSDRGPDVKRLQELLATNSEIYPEGLTTGYFGPLTSQAVTRLQEQIGLRADGQVGSTTLTEINSLLAEGAGQSGMVPPGLLKAPGLRKKVGEDDDTGTSSSATSTEDESEDDGDADDEEDEESAEEESDENRGMPDWDRLPIDNELKNRMKSMFGGQGGNPGQRGGR